MSVTGSQQRVLEELLRRLRPNWRSDPALPARIENLLRHDRRFGSRDRRLYRELLYTAVRHLPWIEPLLDSPSGSGPAQESIAWLAADIPATHDFRRAMAAGALAEGRSWPEAVPATVAEKAALLAPLAGDSVRASLLPEWLRVECPAAFAEPDYSALNTRAPLWLRLQTEDASAVFEEFSRHGWAWRRSETVPAAIELLAEADVTGTDAYREGRIEVQDIGSQLILEKAFAEPGERWLDACAGAGGKALQLAGLLGKEGRVDTHDIRPDALAELDRRAARAGLGDRIRRPAKLVGDYDGVLVDAPCSGSGTWRRAPHLKWTTTPARVQAEARRQLELLGRFSSMVRPDGRLIYATCSLCRTENEAVVAQFLAAHGDFALLVQETLLPSAHNGDGFFVASLKRN